MPAATTALTSEARQAVARLTQAVLAVKPLAGALERPVRIAAASGSITPRIGDAAYPRLLDRVASRLDVPRLEIPPGLALADLDIFERAISHRLGLERLGEPAFELPAGSLSRVDEIDEIVDEVRRASLPGGCARAEVTSFDGAPLRAYALGTRRASAVVLASACGMPVELCGPWMRRLAEEHMVVTWESRGLFGSEGFDGLAHDTAAQAADLFAVMDHFGVASGHLMGMCGGVTIALTAASLDPERVTSLSLWYGDYNLGPASPRTAHQRDLVDFLAMAGEDRATAASLRTVFCRSLLSAPVPDLAHLSLYPYAGDELLFRYAKLVGSLMATDVHPLLERIAQPALVVTSEDDTKAHPAGSRLAAAGLANATLHVEPHGDHITLFHADPGVTELAARFIARAGDPAPALSSTGRRPR